MIQQRVIDVSAAGFLQLQDGAGYNKSVFKVLATGLGSRRLRVCTGGSHVAAWATRGGGSRAVAGPSLQVQHVACGLQQPPQLR